MKSTLPSDSVKIAKYPAGTHRFSTEWLRAAIKNIRADQTAVVDIFNRRIAIPICGFGRLENAGWRGNSKFLRGSWINRSD